MAKSPRSSTGRPWATTLVGVALLVGCATTGYPTRDKETYRALFAGVIATSLDRHEGNNVCLPPLFGFGPVATETVEVNVDNDAKTPQSPLGRRVQLDALANEGLVTATETTRPINGKPQRFVIYQKTDLGRSFGVGNTLCYGRAALDRVVKWKGPAIIGEYQAAFVYYTVKTTVVAPWAKSPAVIAAFPTVAAIVRGEPKERQVVIDLSSEGWGIAEYSKLLQLE